MTAPRPDPIRAPHPGAPARATTMPQAPLSPSFRVARAPLAQGALALALSGVLAGCASVPRPEVRRDGTYHPAAQAGPRGPQTTVVGGVAAEPLDADTVDAGPRPQIRRGTGQVINRDAATAPLPNLPATGGEATFNFEGESLHAVVKAILGDMLGQNYVIAPGVQGTVTLATPRPVSSAGALNLLEMVLGWNNARLVYAGGRYNIVPADQALAGNVAPRTASAAVARGFEARAVPLRYVSATEMERVPKPYARPNAIVNVDNGRNVITDAGLPSAVGRGTWSSLAGSVVGLDSATSSIPAGLGWTFLGRNAAAVINVLDQVTDLQLLQAPSILVRNNVEATLNVGSRIPIASVTVNPGLGSGETTFSQVQYLDTGVILKVRPRVTREGLVFLDIVQEISSPGGQADRNGNVRIDTRKVKTETAIQSGDTVLLAGLISDGVTRGSSGFPGLSRIPVIGGLFGTQSSRTDRNEVIVLLTPTIVRNPAEARGITDEYGRRFRALEPIRRTTPKR